MLSRAVLGLCHSCLALPRRLSSAAGELPTLKYDPPRVSAAARAGPTRTGGLARCSRTAWTSTLPRVARRLPGHFRADTLRGPFGVDAARQTSEPVEGQV